MITSISKGPVIKSKLTQIFQHCWGAVKLQNVNTLPCPKPHQCIGRDRDCPLLSPHSQPHHCGGRDPHCLLPLPPTRPWPHPCAGRAPGCMLLSLRPQLYQCGGRAQDRLLLSPRSQTHQFEKRATGCLLPSPAFQSHQCRGRATDYLHLQYPFHVFLFEANLHSEHLHSTQEEQMKFTPPLVVSDWISKSRLASRTRMLTKERLLSAKSADPVVVLLVRTWREWNESKADMAIGPPNNPLLDAENIQLEGGTGWPWTLVYTCQLSQTV